MNRKSEKGQALVFIALAAIGLFALAMLMAQNHAANSPYGTELRQQAAEAVEAVGSYSSQPQGTPPGFDCNRGKSQLQKLVDYVRSNGGDINFGSGVRASIDDYPLGERLLITGMNHPDFGVPALLNITGATSLDDFLTALQWASGNQFSNKSGLFSGTYKTDSSDWPPCP